MRASRPLSPTVTKLPSQAANNRAVRAMMAIRMLKPQAEVERRRVLGRASLVVLDVNINACPADNHTVRTKEISGQHRLDPCRDLRRRAKQPALLQMSPEVEADAELR